MPEDMNLLVSASGEIPKRKVAEIKHALLELARAEDLLEQMLLAWTHGYFVKSESLCQQAIFTTQKIDGCEQINENIVGVLSLIKEDIIKYGGFSESNGRMKGELYKKLKENKVFNNQNLIDNLKKRLERQIEIAIEEEANLVDADFHIAALASLVPPAMRDLAADVIRTFLKIIQADEKQIISDFTARFKGEIAEVTKLSGLQPHALPPGTPTRPPPPSRKRVADLTPAELEARRNADRIRQADRRRKGKPEAISPK